MSLTCQLPPTPVTVTAYCALDWLRPAVSVIFSVIVTMKVMLDGPYARSEPITALPVETCFSLVLAFATPGTE
jgi:hypothetical protein